MASNLKTVRIIAYNARMTQTMKTVNVHTTAPVMHEYPQHTQAAGAPAAAEFPTYMAAGAANSAIANLPTVYIPGYSGPA